MTLKELFFGNGGLLGIGILVAFIMLMLFIALIVITYPKMKIWKRCGILAVIAMILGIVLLIVFH